MNRGNGWSWAGCVVVMAFGPCGCGTGGGGGFLDECSKSDNRCEGEVAHECSEKTTGRFNPSAWTPAVTDCAASGNRCALVEGYAVCLASETPCDCNEAPVATCEDGQETYCTAVAQQACRPVRSQICAGTCKADGTITLCAIEETVCDPATFVTRCDGKARVIDCECVAEGCFPSTVSCQPTTACSVQAEFEGNVPAAGCYLE